MKTNHILIALAIIAAGTGAYFAFKKDPKKELLALTNANTTDSEKSKTEFINLINNKFTAQEMKDVYKYLSIEMNNPKAVSDMKKDLEFMARINVISRKYNIFT